MLPLAPSVFCTETGELLLGADFRAPLPAGARDAAIAVLTADDLALAENTLGLKGSPTRVVRIFRPRVSREGELLPARDDEAIEKAAERAAAFIRASNPL